MQHVASIWFRWKFPSPSIWKPYPSPQTDLSLSSSNIAGYKKLGEEISAPKAAQKAVSHFGSSAQTLLSMHETCILCWKVNQRLRSILPKAKPTTQDSLTKRSEFTTEEEISHHTLPSLPPKTVSPFTRCFWLFKCTNFSQHPQTLPQQKYATLHSWVVLLLQFALEGTVTG